MADAAPVPAQMDALNRVGVAGEKGDVDDDADLTHEAYEADVTDEVNTVCWRIL